MTVEELVKELQQYPPTTEVRMRDYTYDTEGGEMHFTVAITDVRRYIRKFEPIVIID